MQFGWVTSAEYVVIYLKVICFACNNVVPFRVCCGSVPSVSRFTYPKM